MPIRFLLVFATLCGASTAAAAQSSVASAPRPVIAAPRYVGPMGANPNPSIFASPQANTNTSPLNPPPMTVTVVNLGKFVMPQSPKKPTCYAIHSYTIKPESDTTGITHPASESTCVAADSSSMKQAAQPSSGPEFR
jgi:hypothetical protein